MKTKQGLHVGFLSDNCRLTDVLIDSDGTPVTSYGYEYKLAGEREVRGWGEIDGLCQVWAHVAGAHEVLLPTSRYEVG